MSIDNFSRALGFTLKYEGGKSNDPRDPGGRTNEGVTQCTYDKYRISRGYQLRNVYSMAPQERDEIYKHGYWDSVTGDSLPSGVDLCVFDYAVNSGPERALRTYSLVGHGKKVGEAIHNICSSRLSFLHALRTWSFFGSGWAKRVAACEAEAIELSGASFGTARDRVGRTQRGKSASFVMFIAALFSIVVKTIHYLSWWQLCVVAIVAIIVAINFFHGSKVTKIRVAVLTDASNREEILKLAMDKMHVSRDAIMNRGR